jgi:hypothetical protein
VQYPRQADEAYGPPAAPLASGPAPMPTWAMISVIVGWLVGWSVIDA